MAKILCSLIKAPIFNKAVHENIPKPLRNLYINFDVNTLRHCAEMACVEEYLHTFGNSDITSEATPTECGRLSTAFVMPPSLDSKTENYITTAAHCASLSRQRKVMQRSENATI